MLEKVLEEHSLQPDYIVRKSGIFSPNGQKIDNVDNFDKYVDNDTIAYISTPSNDAPGNLGYYLTVLEKWGYVVTCEKSVLAHYWHILFPYKNRLWYHATVWGNSGILPELHRYEGKIESIKAVINGTLNIISEQSTLWKTEEELFELVTGWGFAEPGAKNFSDIIENEMRDVLYKSVIFANHSGLYPKIITLSDVIIEWYKPGARCMFVADKNHIRAGFMYDDDTSWFPQGVNNILLVNGEKITEWPWAGARPTAERMYTDSEHLF